MNNEFDFKPVFNGILSEVASAIITYPLNTIKTNSQIGKKIIINGSKLHLLKGIKWCILTEIIGSVIFYSVFSGITKLQVFHPVVRSSLGSTIAIINSYPCNIRRKLLQVGKSINNVNNYKGLSISLINSVPGSTINFTMREHFKEKLPDDLKPLSGLLSTIISIVATHPLDTLSTCIATRTPIKLIDCIKYSGFKERFVEKNLTTGSKMLMLDILNNYNS